MRRNLLRAALALAIAASALPPLDARAQQPSREVRAAAVTLFDDARKLMAAGKYAEACPKLEESQRLDPGVGTLFNLADCHEHIGRTASAWTAFRDVAADASRTGRSDREKVARERAAAIEPRLTRLEIKVAPEAATSGLEVKRDGVVVGTALWGTATPVDPGEHVVTASAPGKEPFEKKIRVEGQGATVAIEIPALAPSASTKAAPLTPAPVGSATPPATTAPPAPAPRVADAPPRSSSLQKPFAVAVGVLGLAAVGVGTALGFTAKSKATSASCDENNICDPQGFTDREDAVALGHVGTIVFIAGAVVAAGGIVLFLTAPSSEAAPKAPVAIGVGPTGAFARGSF